MFLRTNKRFLSQCDHIMQEESNIVAPTEWGETLVFSLSCNNREEQHATTYWKLPHNGIVSRHRRRSVRHTNACMAETIAGRPGALVWRVCRRQRNHCCGGCPAQQGRAGVGISPLRGHPGDPGGGGCPGIARHRSARFPLPAGGLGDLDRHFGTRRTALVPYERWGRCVDGSGGGCFHWLSRSFSWSSCIRASPSA